MSKEIYCVSDRNGITRYFKLWKQAIEFLEVDHKSVEGSRPFKASIGKVDADTPKWEQLSYEEQKYYHHDMECWQKHNKETPKHLKEWEDLSQEDRRTFDFRFLNFCESHGYNETLPKNEE